MKKLLLFVLTIYCSLITVHSISQNCLPEGITFTTQEQIDNFQINYPGCTEIEGDVEIRGVSNLNGLNGLTTIGGDLFINANYLTSLVGLEGVTSIGGMLEIHNNDSLTSLSGLVNLTSVGGLKVSWSDALTSLAGLENLTSIGGDFEIIYSALTNLEGLEGVTSIGGGLIIWGNDALTNLSGLENLTYISGRLFIGDEVGLGNPALTSIAELSGVTSIGGDLLISRNNTLINLEGLENLTSIGGSLSILGNDSIINLHELQNLTTIEGGIIIGGILDMGGPYGNISLTSLEGLENVQAGSIDDLLIVGNPLLNTCDVQSICDYLAVPNGSVDIYDNAEGCNDPSEIASICGYTIPCLPYGNYHFLSQSDVDNFQINYQGCTELEGNVLIHGGDIESLEGMDVITSIGSNLDIRVWSPLLTDLEGLEGLTSIGENLIIRGNSALTTMAGLENLTSVGADLSISYNNALTSLEGLGGLTSIGGSLHIGPLASWMPGNPLLNSITGLEGVTSIGDDIIIFNNNSLSNLSGLEGVASIGGNLSIGYNETLTSLAGIDNIDGASIDDLTISLNESLSTCEVESVCDYLAAPNGTVEIEYNAPGCNSPEEVEEACDSITSIPEFTSAYSFTIIPNPVQSTAIIKYNLSHESPVSMKILDISGREIKTLVNEVQYQGEQNMVFNTNGLKPGIYLIVLKTSIGMQTMKLIKLE